MVRFLSHAASSRQAYDMTYDCRSVLKHVLKCYDIFSDVRNNRKSCRNPLLHATKIVPCKSALIRAWTSVLAESTDKNLRISKILRK